MNLDKTLAEFQQRIGYPFNNPDLLGLALTHPSHAFEGGRCRRNNQRLEFLGDAVLQLVLTEHLYRQYPQLAEGEMTKLRSALVNRTALAAQARQLNLGHYLLMGRGEERNGGRDRDSSLADAFEAVVGAMYLDGGLAAAAAWLTPKLAPLCAQEAARHHEGNPKGWLQEFLQSRQLKAPTYEVVAATGPDHQREYRVAVRLEGETLAEGVGSNKKAAEIAAALAALQKLQEEPG